MKSESEKINVSFVHAGEDGAMTDAELERYSSAMTLSDMEIFVFPELMYALVLANIMSPVIWRWREEDCFKKLKGKSTYKKLLRLRQYIMDEYDFNLDLETWGLTSTQKELKRFEKFISPEDIAKSNALFGYEGDRYYFDAGIRRHFGLDKYDSDIIPCWKTETVEAMDAFVYRPGYAKKAGECVSLAALYAAAAFVVCGVPLEDIYMILTPLHSQNFLDVGDGLLTNNRRLVTKAMWFNGTAISAKAQRALRNENITMVSHNTGFVHCLYGKATISKGAYGRFKQRLRGYLSAGPDLLMIANFLRANRDYQRYFQFCRRLRGQKKFINAEVLFHYEHGSRFRIADATFDRLIDEVAEEDFSPYKLPDRVCCEQMRGFIAAERIDVKTEDGRKRLADYLRAVVPAADEIAAALAEFLRIEPKLPSDGKKYTEAEPVRFSVDSTREQIIEYLQRIRGGNVTADLAFYAWRDMTSCDWRPFVKAAVERNPVCLAMYESQTVGQLYRRLQDMSGESIYAGPRLAQPDEVANYRRGDGLEKAFTLANVILNKGLKQDVSIIAEDVDVILKADIDYRFISDKGLTRRIDIVKKGDIYIRDRL